MTANHIRLLEAVRQHAPDLAPELTELIKFVEYASEDYAKLQAFCETRPTVGGRLVDSIIAYATRLEERA